MEAISRIIGNIAKSLTSINLLADGLDILLVAFIIYKVAMLIKNTSAAQVAKGIILILFVTWLSGVFGLNVLSFLLSKTVELGFLAIIIMFQPELRRFLEHVGSSNITSIIDSRGKISDISKVIDSTVEICSYFSKQRIGALLVFERVHILDDYTKTGTILNADYSAELVKNIFYPKAMLHDGAIIIRGSKIFAAGCMLPLTNNQNLSRELGMRHRAAIGMSEATDALVILVSEENGAISAAVGGMLKRHLSSETLEKLLYLELASENGDDHKSQKPGILPGFLALFKVKKNDEKDN